MQNSNFKLMGVINITPDSFSDGGLNFDSSSIIGNLKSKHSESISVFDFGAESTAPFNDPITSDEECSRFREHLFPVLAEILKKKKTISIDTYKPDVFSYVADKIYELDKDADIIWNDVSAIVDEKTNQTLKKYPNSHYVLSHNLAPSRSETSSHMNYVDKDLKLSDVVSFFNERLKLLEHENVILDPCFGFSKTAEQNWNLMQKLPELVSEFKSDWLLGISRKSFLKSLVDQVHHSLPGDKRLSYTENLHFLVLSHWFKKLPQGCYFIRLHDAAVGQFLL